MRLTGKILKSRTARHWDRFADWLAMALIFFESFVVRPARAVRFYSDVGDYLVRVMLARCACCVSTSSTHRRVLVAPIGRVHGQPIDMCFSIWICSEPFVARPRDNSTVALRFLQASFSSILQP